jgi:hypothetical protein
MISVDNAVELMVKTFLGLPARVTGLRIPRKEYEEISESFPRLLDAIEKHAPTSLTGVELGEIEWYHRLRNELYHQGNGLTVERDKIVVYAELAKVLFKNLFGVELVEEEHSLLGDFLEEWIGIERALVVDEVDRRASSPPMQGESAVTASAPPIQEKPVLWIASSEPTGDAAMEYALKKLKKIGIISESDVVSINEIKETRNKVVHGKVEHTKVVTPELVARVRALRLKMSVNPPKTGE